jgi:hypothetical protein
MYTYKTTIVIRPKNPVPVAGIRYVDGEGTPFILGSLGEIGQYLEVDTEKNKVTISSSKTVKYKMTFNFSEVNIEFVMDRPRGA